MIVMMLIGEVIIMMLIGEVIIMMLIGDITVIIINMIHMFQWEYINYLIYLTV